MLLLIAGFALASEPCPAPIAVASVRADVVRVEDGWRTQDRDAFMTAVADLRQKVRCVDSALSGPDASAVHRAIGLASTLLRSDSEAQRSFAAARSADPAWTIDETLFPESSRQLGLYSALPIDAGTRVPLPPPASGTLRVDGVPSDSVSGSWPAVIQYIDTSGRVVWTQIHGPGEVVEAYPQPVAKKKSAAKPVLFAAAGVGLLVSGGLMAGAAVTRAEWEAPSDDWQALASLKSTNNALGWSGLVVGGAALATGVVGLTLPL